MEGGGGDVGLLAVAEDGAGGVVEFDAALVGEVDLEGGGVVGREGLEEGDEVVGGGVGEVDALGMGDGDGLVEHGAEEVEHALGLEDGAEGELAGGGDGSQDGEQDEFVPEDVVDVVADLDLEAGGAEGVGDGLDAVGDAAGGFADGGSDFGVLVFDDAGFEDVGGEPGGAADDVFRSKNGCEGWDAVDAVLEGDDGGVWSLDGGAEELGGGHSVS